MQGGQRQAALGQGAASAGSTQLSPTPPIAASPHLADGWRRGGVQPRVIQVAAAPLAGLPALPWVLQRRAGAGHSNQQSSTLMLRHPLSQPPAPACQPQPPAAPEASTRRRRRRACRPSRCSRRASGCCWCKSRQSRCEGGSRRTALHGRTHTGTHSKQQGCRRHAAAGLEAGPADSQRRGAPARHTLSPGGQQRAPFCPQLGGSARHTPSRSVEGRQQ